MDPGPAAPAWVEPDQDDLGGADEDAPPSTPGRSARETGRVAVPDAGPITAPIPAITPDLDDHLTGPAADEPITHRSPPFPRRRPTPAAPSAATPTAPRRAA